MVLVVLRCVWAAAADAGCRTLARADSMRSALPTGHSEDAPLWIRSGNLSLRSTVLFGVVPSAFYFATGGDGWPGRIAYVIVYGYIFLFQLLTYLRCGIWVEQEHVRLRHAFTTIRLSYDQIAGIGLLGYRRLSRRDREMEYLTISVLSITGRWFTMIGLRARAEVAREVAIRLSEATGLPVAESRDRKAARSALLPVG